MPLPPIIVDVAQAEQKPAMAQALLDACSRAASPTPCVTPNQADEEEAFAVAIVVWLENGDSVRVQVGLRRGERAGEWFTRRVEFDASDDESERWTATGFVVGTLAGRFVDEENKVPEANDTARPGTEPGPSRPEPEPAPPFEAPVATPLRERGEDELAFNLGALVRPQFSTGPWGLGGKVQGQYEPGSWPVFVHLGLRGSYRARDRGGLTSYFADADLGLGVVIAQLSEDWKLRGAWSLGLQRMTVQVSRPGVRDRAFRWLGGARAAFEIDWMPWSSLGGFASIGAVWWWGSTDIEVENDVVHEQPSILGEAALGLRLRAL